MMDLQRSNDERGQCYSPYSVMKLTSFRASESNAVWQPHGERMPRLEIETRGSCQTAVARYGKRRHKLRGDMFFPLSGSGSHNSQTTAVGSGTACGSALCSRCVNEPFSDESESVQVLGIASQKRAATQRDQSASTTGSGFDLVGARCVLRVS